MYTDLLDEGREHDDADTGNPASAQMNFYLSEPVIPQNKKLFTCRAAHKCRQLAIF